MVAAVEAHVATVAVAAAGARAGAAAAAVVAAVAAAVVSSAESAAPVWVQALLACIDQEPHAAAGLAAVGSWAVVVVVDPRVHSSSRSLRAVAGRSVACCFESLLAHPHLCSVPGAVSAALRHVRHCAAREARVELQREAPLRHSAATTVCHPPLALRPRGPAPDS